MNTLGIDLKDTNFSRIIRELAEAQIPLESLCLMQCNLNRKLISDIIKLNKLKQLTLSARKEMKLSGFLAFVRNLNELIYLDLKLYYYLDAIDLVQIIQCGPKIRVLKCRYHSRISTFKQFIIL